jgi:2-polyprenyl-3-methyl-5-hydroxy-6-metoxy-1,4-benzoquinol methylase
MKNRELQATYDKIAEDWFKDHKKDWWWIDVATKLAGLLPPGASILDVGCGPGFKSSYFAEKGFKVTGFDFSEEFIKIARREFPAVDFRVLDIYDLDTLKETFDCVFAQAVLLHIPREKAFGVMELMKRKVKPGGVLSVAVRAPKTDKKEGVLIENDYGYEYQRFFSYFTLEEIQNYFKQLGFEIILSDASVFGRTTWVQVIGRLS